MSGAVIRIGRYRTNAGGGLAVVYDTQQLASFIGPNASHPEQLILYRGHQWAGINSGSPLSRVGLAWTATDSSSPGGKRPGGVAAYTHEMAPTVGYTGAGGGQDLHANFVTPFITDPNYTYTGISTNSSGQLGVSMEPAAAISETNEQFYRKEIPGNIPEDPAGSIMTNQGQLVIWFEGEVNQPPNTPGGVSRSGPATQPIMTAGFSDPNEVLNNGVAFDYLVSHAHEIWWGGVQRWSTTYEATQGERDAKVSQRQIGVTLPYDTQIAYFVRHKDRGGKWSGNQSLYFTIPNPNNPPYAPDNVSPASTAVGSSSPTFAIRHKDPDGNSSVYAAINLQTDGGTPVWNWEGGFGVANNAIGYVAGPALQFHTLYRWRSATWDTSWAGSPYSDWTYFTIQHANTKPKPPSNLTPSGNIQGTQSVVLESTFDDVDRVLPNGQSWDHLDAFTIHVRRSSDNTLVYDSGILAPTAAERSNRRTSRAYTIPAWDTDYYWGIQHRDRSGAWSDWSHATIRAASGSSADKPTSPAGFITNLANPGSITSVYRNTAGLSMKAWQIGLFSEQGTLAKTSPVFSATVAPGGSITSTWAASGLGALGQGVKYKIGVNVQASNDQWSGWSPLQDIQANATPHTPIHVSPNDGISSSQLLPLQVSATDADGQALTLTLQLLTMSDVNIGTIVMDPVAGTPGLFSKDPSSLITSHQSFKWRAKASDGFADSPYSPTRSYTYAPVPTVNLVSPTSPITTSTPTVIWSHNGQDTWEVALFADNDEKVYSAVGSGPGTTHQIQAVSNWIGSERWNHLEELDLQVFVTKSGVTGASVRRPLLLNYDLPEPLALIDAEELALPGTWGTNYVAISHAVTSYPAGQFVSVEWSRVEVDGPGGTEIPGTRKNRYLVNTNASDPTLTDFYVKSGQWYRYAYHQNVVVGVDTIAGQATSVEAMVEWKGVVLHMPFAPLDFSAHLMVAGPGQPYEVEGEWKAEMSQISRMSGAGPIGINPPGTSAAARGSFGLITRGSYTAKQQFGNLLRLWKAQFKRHSPDGRPHGVCWREGRGNDNSIMFGQLSVNSPRSAIGQSYAVSLELVEVDFVYGEEAQ